MVRGQEMPMAVGRDLNTAPADGVAAGVGDVAIEAASSDPPQAEGFVLLNDQPVSRLDGADDVLGMAEEVSGLASLIMGSRKSAPFTLAIDASWGMGKSSLMLQLKAALDLQPGVATSWFNAWTAEEGDALAGVIKSALMSVDENVLRRTLRRVARHRSFLAGLRVMLIVVASFFHLARSVDQLWDVLSVDASSRSAIHEDLEEIFGKWAAGNKRTSKGRLLVVFVDDLDRCSSEVVVRVCEAMRLYLALPGIVFVIGCDQDLLSQAALKTGIVSQAATSLGYLEKIVQITYRRPAYDEQQMSRLVDYFAGKSETTKLFGDSARQIVVQGTERNPRRIKRLINSFILEYRLDPVLASLGAETLISVILLQHFYPEFYRLLARPQGPDVANEFLTYQGLRSRLQLGDSPDESDREFFREHGARPPAVEREDNDAVSRLEQFLPVVFPGLAKKPEFVQLLSALRSHPDFERLRSRLQSRTVEALDFVSSVSSGVVADAALTGAVLGMESSHETERSTGPAVSHISASDELAILLLADSDSYMTESVSETLAKYSLSRRLSVRKAEPGIGSTRDALARGRSPDSIVWSISGPERYAEAVASLTTLRQEKLYLGPAIIFTDRVTPARKKQASDADASLTDNPNDLVNFLDTNVGAKVRFGGGAAARVEGVVQGAQINGIGEVHYGRPLVASQPVRLAPRPSLLAGREELLAVLDGRLAGDSTESPRVVVLCGLGGAGKTSVAVEYAYRHMARLGVVWQFPAEEPAGLAAGFSDLAAALGASDELSKGDPVAAVHGALAARPGDWLLIFDNATSAAAIRSVLPPAGNGQVLITSRNAHWPVGQVLDVPVLDIEAAAAFLVNRTGATEQEAVELATELGGLPLALEQAAAYMQVTGLSVVAYLALFQERSLDLLARGDPAGYDKQVTTTWALAFSQIEERAPQAAGLLRLLACCSPEAIPLGLLLQPRPELVKPFGTVVGPLLAPLQADPLAVDDAVAVLREYSLISAPQDGWVSVQRLVQAVTLAQLPAEAATAWRDAAAVLIEAALPGDPRLPASWHAYAALLPHARAALPAYSEGIGQIASWLGAIGSYAAARDLWRQVVEARERALGPDAPDTLAARGNLARWTGEAGDAAGARDQFAALLPLHEQVLGPDAPDTLAARGNLAYWTGQAGDPAGALRLAQELLPDQVRVLGPEHPDTLATRGSLARWTGQAGDPAGALRFYEELLPDQVRVLGPEHPDTLAARSNIAYLTGQAGDPAGARDQFAALLPLYEQVLGPEHTDTLAARSSLARWTGEAERYRSASDE
jgi:hypothetical protein